MNHVMNWLLEDKTPEVKYRTMKELQGRTIKEADVKVAYECLLDSIALRRVLEKFQSTNKWEHINAFLALHEYGLTRQDISIDDHVEGIIGKLNGSTKCAKTLLLRNLVSLGYYEHPWVYEQVHQSLAGIREDGTCPCLDRGKKTNDSKLPGMGCYRQTTTCLLLAAELKKAGILLPQYESLIDFYMKHQILYHEPEHKNYIIEDMTRTFFPIDHVNIGIQMILYGLSVLGNGKRDQAQPAYKKLESYRDDQGKYILSHSFQNPYFEVGRIGVANKWITLYGLLIDMYRAL